MVLIRTLPEAAPSIAYSLGGYVWHDRWVVVSHSIDHRAARQAAALAVDSNPTLVNFDFKLGVLIGTILPVILWGAFTTGMVIASIIKQVDTEQLQITPVVSEQNPGGGRSLFHDEQASN